MRKCLDCQKVIEDQFTYCWPCWHKRYPPTDCCSPQCDVCNPAVAPVVPTKDVVNHPSHYTAGKIECIDALEAATVNLTGIEAFCTACAIKYLWRWKLKGGLEDLKKARWYLNRLIGDAK